MTEGGRFSRGRAGLLLAALVAVLTALWATPAFAATCQPQIIQGAAQARWASIYDYNDRILTVDQSVSQSGCTPCSLRVTAVRASNAVRTLTPMPLGLGTVSAATPESFEVRYQVPPGVATFISDLKTACVGDSATATDPPPLSISPAYALANQGCPPGPVPELAGLPLPADQSYTPRRFIVTLRDAGGNPVTGRQVKWSLSIPVMTEFFIIDSSDVTDSQGQAYAVVSPAVYLTDIAPYFSKDSTEVTARTADGLSASALFVYTRCAPPGETPPWA